MGAQRSRKVENVERTVFIFGGFLSLWLLLSLKLKVRWKGCGWMVCDVDAYSW